MLSPFVGTYLMAGDIDYNYTVGIFMVLMGLEPDIWQILDFLKAGILG